MNHHEYWLREIKSWSYKEWWRVFNKHLLWEVSDEIKVARGMATVSQAELAARVGTTQSGIARFERGRENITISRLKKIAYSLGCIVKIQIIPLKRAVAEEIEYHQARIPDKAQPIYSVFMNSNSGNATYTFSFTK